MNAESLRASILQEAIQGRLVPQLESEPEVEQVGEPLEDAPFVIPRQWKWIRLENLFLFIDYRGKTPIKSEYGVRLITASNIRKGYIDHKRVEYISLSEYENRQSRGISQKGDILFTTEAPLGNASLADIETYSTGQRVITLRSLNNLILHEFAVYEILSSYFQKTLKDNATGTTAQGIKAARLKKLWLPIPPLEEQHRIVAKLNELLPLVETYGKEQEALEKVEKKFPDKLRASLLQEAIQGKLVPQLESEPEVEQIGEAPEDVPFAIPEKWKWVRVSDVAHTNPKVTAQTSSTEVSFIPMAALSAGYTSQITLDAKRSWGTVKNGYTKFTDGDVLLAKITPCFQNRKSAIAKKLSNGIGCGSSEFHVLRVSKKYVTQEYLLMFLKSQWFITYGVENFKGTAGQQRLGTSDLKNCLFPLPPLSEQHRIVEKLNELLGSVSQLEHTVSVP